MGMIKTHTIQVIEKYTIPQDEPSVNEKPQFVHFVIRCLVKFFVVVICSFQ